jgi:hypothetical protein
LGFTNIFHAHISPKSPYAAILEQQGLAKWSEFHLPGRIISLHLLSSFLTLTVHPDGGVRAAREIIDLNWRC